MGSMCIEDSGIRFDPKCPQGTATLGLISMPERMRLVGGQLSIRIRIYESWWKFRLLKLRNRETHEMLSASSFLFGSFNDGQIRSNLQIDEQLNLVFHLKEAHHENRRQRLFHEIVVLSAKGHPLIVEGHHSLCQLVSLLVRHGQKIGRVLLDNGELFVAEFIEIGLIIVVNGPENPRLHIVQLHGLVDNFSLLRTQVPPQELDISLSIEHLTLRRIFYVFFLRAQRGHNNRRKAQGEKNGSKIHKILQA